MGEGFWVPVSQAECRNAERPRPTDRLIVATHEVPGLGFGHFGEDQVGATIVHLVKAVHRAMPRRG
jgi:hypothetical protein